MKASPKAMWTLFSMIQHFSEPYSCARKTFL